MGKFVTLQLKCVGTRHLYSAYNVHQCMHMKIRLCINLINSINLIKIMNPTVYTVLYNGTFQRFNKYTYIVYFNYIANISIHKLQQDAFKIFMAGVQAVSPRKLVSDALIVSNNKLVIRDKEYSLHKNVHLVGFGKAVLGMVEAVEGILGSHIVQGVVSVPCGTTSEVCIVRCSTLF